MAAYKLKRVDYQTGPPALQNRPTPNLGHWSVYVCMSGWAEIKNSTRMEDFQDKACRVIHLVTEERLHAAGP